MKHKTIPGTPHLNTMNPKIQISNTPYSFAEETAPWNTNALPRRAGVNSFGFGGVNAHVILEEVEIQNKTQHSSLEQLFVFSAKSKTSLLNYMKCFADFIDENSVYNVESDTKEHELLRSIVAQELSLPLDAVDLSLPPIELGIDQVLAKSIVKSFNIQSVGQLTFTELVQSQSLAEILLPTSSKENLKHSYSLNAIAFTLQTGREEYRYRFAVVTDSLPSLQETIATLSAEDIIDSNEYNCNSEIIKGENLHQLKEQWYSKAAIEFERLHDTSVRRVSLPGYSFKKTTYWFDDDDKLHSSIDSISEDEIENYCENHKIFNENIVPGAVLFNLCFNKAESKEPFFPLHINEVNWINKVSSKDISSLETSIGSSKKNTIWLQSNSTKFCSLLESEQPTESFTEPEDKGLLKTLLKADVYKELKEFKYEYGELLQSIQTIKYNDKSATVELKATEERLHKYTFPPSLMDGAFQAVRFMIEGNNSVLIPKNISAISILKPIPRECFATIFTDTSSIKPLTFNILFRDIRGIEVALIKGYEVAPLLKLENALYFYHEKEISIPVPAKQNSDTGSLLISHSPLLEEIQFHDNSHSVALDFTNTTHFEDLKDYCLNSSILSLLCYVDSLFENLDDRELSKPFISLQKLYKNLPETIQRIVLLSTKNTDHTKSLSSFVAVCNNEFSHLRTLLLKVDNYSEQRDLLRYSSYQDVEHSCLTVSSGMHTATMLQPITLNKGEAVLAEGTYLITGGTGSIGLQVLTFLQSKLKKSTFVLWGRKEQNVVMPPIPTAQHNNEVIYQKVDISKRNEVEDAVTKTDIFTFIRGIFHCAGVVRDRLFSSLDEKDIKAVLSAKILGTKNLNSFFNLKSLDYFVLFSSTSSYLGKSGQSIYAYANGYLNNFAAQRNEERKAGKAFGKTISICWPYWEQGGMQLTEKQKDTLFSLYGMHPLPSKRAFEILNTVLASNTTSPVIMFGIKNKINNAIENVFRIMKSKPNSQDTNTQKISKEAIEIIVRDAISTLTAINANEFDSTEIITNYGLDSITLTELSQELQESLHTDITPVTLFEINTIDKLTEYIYETTSLEILDSSDEIENTPILKAGNTICESDLAIVGIDCTFPGAKDHREFWQNLVDKKCSVSEFPIERWLQKDDLHIKHGGFINSIRHFDREYFSLSKIESELMDPQQRLLLHSVINSLSDAGMTPSDIKESETGVFVGISSNDYRELLIEETDIIQPQTATGNANSIVANRISYNLDLYGPSEAIDTACSSSLVALHRAVQSIQNGDCTSAFVAGVNALLSPRLFIAFDKAGMLSKEGRCASFDHKADGYVRGEGVGTIFIKKLQDAINDNNHIYATIKGGAINHGGRSNSLTAPKADAQAKLIVKALKNADIGAETISYIEAHGTGTKLGDPIEIEGLKKVFGRASQTCGIGTVKANIGHLESAAGIAGIIKVAKALQQKELPGLATFSNINPYISLDDSPLFLLEDTQTWPDTNSPRRAGVSSFGFGGVNAHYILEEFASTGNENSKAFPLFVLSARTQNQLHSYAKILLKHINETNNISIEGILYTLQIGREQHLYRVSFTCESIEKLKEELKKIIANDDSQIQLVSRQSKEYAVQTFDTLETVCERWNEGFSLNWKKHYENSNICRVSLPALPFITQEYWFPTKEVKEERQVVVSSNAEKLYKLIAEILNDSEVYNTDKSLEELGIDSILRIKLGHEIEKAFSVSIDISQLAQIKHIDDLLEFLPNYESAKPSYLPQNEFEKIYAQCFGATENATISRWQYKPEQEIEYLDIGTGEPILFYNGLGFTFAAIHNLLIDLAKSKRVIIFNYPGIGNSTSLSGEYSVKLMNDISIKLLAHLRIDTVDIIGWSLGGFLSQAFTEKHSEKVKSMTIINSAHYLHGDYSLASVDAMMTLVQDTFQKELQRVSYEKQKEIISQIRGTSNAADSFKLFKFAMQFNHKKRFFKINKPTLIIAGEKDEIINPQETQQLYLSLQDKNQDVMLKTFSNENHYIPMFAKEKVTDTFNDFLSN